MPEGGTITLATEHISIEVDDVASFPDLEPGRYVVLSITDNGAGMTAEVRERAFDPFFTTKQVGKGTGLGLSVSYGIVEKLGGRIEVETVRHHGTTMTVRLPGLGESTEEGLED